MGHLYGQDAFLCLPKTACYRLIGAIIHYRYGDNSLYKLFIDQNQNEWFLADDASVSLACFCRFLILHMKHFRLELSVQEKYCNKTLFYFFMNYAVIIVKYTTELVLYIWIDIENTVHFLSISECHRILNNEWFTDEVGITHSSQ